MRRRRWWRWGRGRPMCLRPLGIKLPLGVKRGYHRHFRARGNAGLTRPVLDAEIGYCLAPMEQGIRLTTGVEFAARDAPPTPVQIERVMPWATSLFPLAEPVGDDALDGQPAVLCRFKAGDRPRARAARACGSPTAMPIGG